MEFSAKSGAVSVGAKSDCSDCSPCRFRPILKKRNDTTTSESELIIQRVAKQIAKCILDKQDLFDQQPLDTRTSSCRLPSRNRKNANRRTKKLLADYCTFCFTKDDYTRYLRGGGSLSPFETGFWNTHKLKDRNGNISCPILRQKVCGFCQATGDQAHTERYCPVKKAAELELPLC